MYYNVFHSSQCCFHRLWHPGSQLPWFPIFRSVDLCRFYAVIVQKKFFSGQMSDDFCLIWSVRTFKIDSKIYFGIVIDILWPGIIYVTLDTFGFFWTENKFLNPLKC